MANTLKLYPFSDPDGTPIPLEIVDGGIGCIRQPFTGAATNGLVLPACDFVYLIANTACYVRFAATITFPADGVLESATYYVPAGLLMILDHEGALLLSVIRETASGVLNIQCCNKYKGLRKATQYQNN